MKPLKKKHRWSPTLLPGASAATMIEMSHMRLVVVFIGFALCFLTLSVRLFAVSVLTPESHSSNSRRTSSQAEANRQEIIDRNGNILAINLATASLYANPKVVLDAKEAAQKLHKALPELKYDKLLTQLSSEKTFVWVKRNLTPKEQYTVNALGIPGLYFEREERRIYPQGRLLSHVLGYVGMDAKGLSGIEKTFDDTLRDVKNPDNGPLQLSIDLRVQSVLHEELLSHMTTFKAKGAAGIVMDARNGEIVGMVSLPDFDPHHPGKADNDSKFNRNTLGVYEMGSTFKTFTIATALDSGVTSMRSSYDTDKPIRVGRFAIRDFHPEGGWLTVPEIMMYSSNIGSAKIALEIGANVQQHYMRELGLLNPPNIELPEKGLPIYPAKWREVNTMTISYGHGIAVTPIQVAQALAPVVNGGTLYTPTLLKRDPKEPLIGKTVLSERTSSQMRELLRLVVEKGTGGKGSAVGYMVGGKTGTAEKINATGRYNQKSLLSSFVSAFPINNPKYVVFVMLDEPVGNKSTGGYATGGMVAAPIARNVISRIGPMLGIMPVDEKDPELRRSFWVDINPDGEKFASN